MKSSLHRMDSDINRGIERWENEGGRLSFVGSWDARSLNYESEWFSRFCANPKRSRGQTGRRINNHARR